MYGPVWPFLLMYGSHDMRHTGFRRLTVVNETPEIWGITNSNKINSIKNSGDVPKEHIAREHMLNLTVGKGKE